jgi:hypothetical protein
MQARVAAALATCRHLRHGLDRVEADEATVRAELAGLKADVDELTLALGCVERPDTNVETFPYRTVAAE